MYNPIESKARSVAYQATPDKAPKASFVAIGVMPDSPERERVLCVDRRDFRGFAFLDDAGDSLTFVHELGSAHTAQRPATVHPVRAVRPVSEGPQMLCVKRVRRDTKRNESLPYGCSSLL